MGKSQIIRFASGNPTTPLSGIWRLIVHKNDVYLGVSKIGMGMLKMSLHESGVWVLAATRQSKVTYYKGNRRFHRWEKPMPHVQGVTRGPSVLIPNTPVSSRRVFPDEDMSKVSWIPGPEAGEIVEFDLYFVDSDSEFSCTSYERLVADCPLANGGYVALLSYRRPTTMEFQARIEEILKIGVFQFDDVSGFVGGSLLWFTESEDSLKTPMVVDLPIPVVSDW